MQSRTMSMVEMTTGKILGFVVAVSSQMIVYPLYFDQHIPITQNMQLGLIFMSIAAVKSYGVRRFFNWLQWGRNNEPRRNKDVEIPGTKT